MAGAQLSLLDLLGPQLLVRPVDPDGQVVAKPDEEFTLVNGAATWERVRVQLHEAPEGWMWGTSTAIGGTGCSYQIGPKWGRFACSRDEALLFARQEVLAVCNRGPADAWSRRVQRWVLALS